MLCPLKRPCCIYCVHIKPWWHREIHVHLKTIMLSTQGTIEDHKLGEFDGKCNLRLVKSMSMVQCEVGLCLTKWALTRTLWPSITGVQHVFNILHNKEIDVLPKNKCALLKNICQHVCMSEGDLKGQETERKHVPQGGRNWRTNPEAFFWFQGWSLGSNLKFREDLLNKNFISNWKHTTDQRSSDLLWTPDYIVFFHCSENDKKLKGKKHTLFALYSLLFWRQQCATHELP